MWTKLSFLFDKYLGLDGWVVWYSVSLTFYWPQKLFRSGCTISHSYQQCKSSRCCTSLSTLGIFIFILDILIAVLWHLIVILLDIFLMTDDVENLFICLFGICISSLVKCLLKSFAHLKNVFLIFLFLSLESSSYNLYRSPLPEIWFTNIFSVA